MFEKPSENLAPLPVFLSRVARHVFLGLLLIFVTLYIGMLGYHNYEHMSWIDSFNNAAMILSSMGPAAPLTTYGGKLFSGIYALFCGLFFIFILGVIFSPLIHRFLHKFHFYGGKKSSDSDLLKDNNHEK